MRSLVRLPLLLSLAVCFSTCSSREKTAPAPNAASQLLAIPQASPAKYKHIRDMRNWRNPYLLIRVDGVGLLDPGENAEILLKPEELLDALARLPASAWPYGRVVAVAEMGVRASEQDAVAIRRNKGIVGGILEGAHVAVDWVPSG